MNIKEIAVYKYRSSARKKRKNRQKGVPCKYVHFSLDDVIDIFEDITLHQKLYKSIFEQSTLEYLKTLHDIYGIKVSMYCFFKNEKGFDLSQATDRFAEEFQANSDWIRFGFHGYDCHKIYKEAKAKDLVSDYQIVLHELNRITGGGNCLTDCIRLSSFQGEKEFIRQISYYPQGIKTLLTSDDDRSSYMLTINEEHMIRSGEDFQRDGIRYIHTDMRIEYFPPLKTRINILDSKKTIVFFTHEYYLSGFKIRQNLERFLLEILKKNIDYSFLDTRKEGR